MSHVTLTIDGAVVYDSGATVTPVTPTPPPIIVLPPPGPLTIPPGFSGDLTVAGQHFPLQTGPSKWRVPGRTSNFGISVAGGMDKTTVTVLDPGDNVAQLPLTWGGGPASREFFAGAGELQVAVSIPGDYTVVVAVTNSSGQDTIELRDA